MTYLFVYSAIFLTSLLSGILGMGGGILLAGVLALLLPLSTALLIHAVAQLTANLYRALLFRHHIQLNVIRNYLVGMALTLALFSVLTLTLEKPLFYFLLGAIALASNWLPKNLTLDATKPKHGIVAGIFVSALHLFVGVAGPLLDLFFQNTTLNRFQIVATKAATQTLGHFMRIAFYLTLLDTDIAALPTEPGILVLVIGIACIGTFAGSKLLTIVSESQFKRASKMLLQGVGVLFIFKGLLAFS